MTSQQWCIYAVLPIIGYLFGSMPFAVLIAKSKGIDLRAHGSGNLGATNVARVIGRKWGYLCFLLDLAKGFVPVLAAGVYLRQAPALMLAEQLAWLGVALGAIAGHMFSFWLRFRGGKGVATSLGVLLGFWPYFTLPALAAAALWVAVTLIWRYVSLGSIVAAAAFPIFFFATCLLRGKNLAEVPALLVFALLMPALVIYRHRSNLARLLGGRENKIAAKPGNKERL